MFKVVPDQLKISEGWVRCGHCADVFDATLYLETWVPAAPEPDRLQKEEGSDPAWDVPDDTTILKPQAPVWEAQDAPSGEAVEVAALLSAAPSVGPAEAPMPALAPPWSEPPGGRGLSDPPATGPDLDDRAAWRDLSGRAPDPREPEPIEPTAWQNPDAPASKPVFVAVTEPVSADRIEVFAAPAVPPLVSDAPLSQVQAPTGRETLPEPEPDFQAELERLAAAAGGPSRPDNDGAQPPPDAVVQTAPGSDTDRTLNDEPGFVRQARRRAFWRSPGARAALGALAVLLAVLLVGQWALHERDQLAARHPDVSPLLTRLCEPLGCEVGPVRRIDAVVIDSSTLVRRLGNFYSFDLVLKNTAALPVAMPALELSLTDTRDSVIARRVFLPQELPDAPRLLPARGSLSLSLRLSITEAGAVSMAGYRALVFYP